MPSALVYLKRRTRGPPKVTVGIRRHPVQGRQASRSGGLADVVRRPPRNGEGMFDTAPPRSLRDLDHHQAAHRRSSRSMRTRAAYPSGCSGTPASAPRCASERGGGRDEEGKDGRPRPASPARVPVRRRVVRPMRQRAHEPRAVPLYFPRWFWMAPEPAAQHWPELPSTITTDQPKLKGKGSCTSMTGKPSRPPLPETAILP